MIMEGRQSDTKGIGTSGYADGDTTRSIKRSLRKDPECIDLTKRPTRNSNRTAQNSKQITESSKRCSEENRSAIVEANDQVNISVLGSAMENLKAKIFNPTSYQQDSKTIDQTNKLVVSPQSKRGSTICLPMSLDVNESDSSDVTEFDTPRQSTAQKFFNPGIRSTFPSGASRKRVGKFDKYVKEDRTKVQQITKQSNPSKRKKIRVSDSDVNSSSQNVEIINIEHEGASKEILPKSDIKLCENIISKKPMKELFVSIRDIAPDKNREFPENKKCEKPVHNNPNEEHQETSSSPKRRGRPRKKQHGRRGARGATLAESEFVLEKMSAPSSHGISSTISTSLDDDSISEVAVLEEDTSLNVVSNSSETYSGLSAAVDDGFSNTEATVDEKNTSSLSSREICSRLSASVDDCISNTEVRTNVKDNIVKSVSPDKIVLPESCAETDQDKDAKHIYCSATDMQAKESEVSSSDDIFSTCSTLQKRETITLLESNNAVLSRRKESRSTFSFFQVSGVEGKANGEVQEFHKRNFSAPEFEQFLEERKDSEFNLKINFVRVRTDCLTKKNTLTANSSNISYLHIRSDKDLDFNCVYKKMASSGQNAIENDDDAQEYLKKFSPLLEMALHALNAERPSDPIQYLANWLLSNKDAAYNLLNLCL